jgi:hypothetical protein
VFASLFNTDKMPKNDIYIKSVVEQLQRYPNLIEPLNTRIKEILANGIKEDTQRYVRFILNEDVLSHVEKSVKEKLSKGKEKQPNDVMADILGLANSKKSIAMESEYTKRSRNFGVSDKSVRRY